MVFLWSALCFLAVASAYRVVSPSVPMTPVQMIAAEAVVIQPGLAGPDLHQQSGQHLHDPELPGPLVPQGPAFGPSQQRETGDLTCISNTGSTCMIQSCLASLGPTFCSWGHCYCASGCVAADGTCQNQSNVPVGQEFALRNLQFKDKYLQVSSTSDELKVGLTNTDRSAFKLYELPGSSPEAPQFLLAATQYRDVVAAITRKSKVASQVGSLVHVTWPQQVPLTDVAVALYAAPGHPGAVIIKAAQAPNQALFLPKGSSDVKTRSGDPGMMGYWVPEPPLDMPLPPYPGQPCQTDCGLAAGLRACLALLLTLLPLAMPSVELRA